MLSPAYHKPRHQVSRVDPSIQYLEHEANKWDICNIVLLLCVLAIAFGLMVCQQT